MDSEAATDEVCVAPGTIMVLTPPDPSSVVEVVKSGFEEVLIDDFELDDF